jgi:hypothetical protein
MDNEYLITIRLACKDGLDPEAMRRIEGKVQELVRHAVWEASGAAGVQAKVWGRHEGTL